MGRKNMFDLSWSDFDKMVFSNDPDIKKLFIIPELSEKQKRKLAKQEQKKLLKKQGYPEPDQILSTLVDERNKVRYPIPKWYEHLCHHVRIERCDAYFSIQCVTCGHERNGNHNGLEIDRIYPDDKRFEKSFERKKTKQKRYSYYSCKHCESQISMIHVSDKWLLKRCPICGTKDVIKHRDIELYDHETVLRQSNCRKLRLQLDFFKDFCRREFKDASYIYDYKNNRMATQFRVKDPYITKQDYIKNSNKNRFIAVLKKDNILTDQNIIGKLKKSAEWN